MSIKINKLEIENVKRVKAVKLEPSSSGLTIIGGDNNQGKTSVLDAIAWALGGNKYKPTNPQRTDSVIPPNLHLVMNNGLVVERKGKNSDLKVIDPAGNKSGQQLLDSFVEQLALDLPRFMESSSKDKANTLLQIIGVGDKLAMIEREEAEVYNQRHGIGVIADQKSKYAKEQPYYPDAPKEPISAMDLIKQQQEILARNGENQRKREQLKSIEHTAIIIKETVLDLMAKLEKARAEEAAIEAELTTARKSALDLMDEGTEELERNLANIEAINIKVRANLDKDKAEEDAKHYAEQYSALSSKLEAIRKSKQDLLTNADLPLPGLSVDDGDLLYNGFRWDGMSGADQLKVATAIVRKLNPNCGFVILDKLEQMDLKTLKEFGAWLEQEDLQVIATRVSTGSECSLIIEDGYSTAVQPAVMAVDQAPKTWKEGEF